MACVCGVVYIVVSMYMVVRRHVHVLMPMCVCLARASAGTGDIPPEGNPPDELLALIEIVVGVAVCCPNRNDYIQDIFSLPPDSQAVLKTLIESAMAHCTDLDVEGGEGSGGSLPVTTGNVDADGGFTEDEYRCSTVMCMKGCV